MAQKAPKHILQAHGLICGRDKLSRKLHSKAEYRHLAEVRSLFEDRNIVGLGPRERQVWNGIERANFHERGVFL
jgi:hypothetical protein